MIISLTGTPGVGKSSVARILKKDYDVIDLMELALKEGFVEGYDRDRESYIIDMDGLVDYLRKKRFRRGIILESHLSHLVDFSDLVIVLRCRPDVLRKRLEEKGWREEKIRENIDAEILDIILCEAIDIHGTRKVFEIDTTERSVEEVADIIRKLIDGKGDLEIYKPGNVDWSNYIGGMRGWSWID
ncbi:MAG TPA: hypothetical protein ENG60_00165 [Thermoplasmatales archaeon]|nr:hypothetical protein [Thermoplasmatales archaeon]HEX16823.1 hypothetical protein [Thermoplasmatales archaeon]